jgi:hypothetical protein
LQPPFAAIGKNQAQQIATKASRYLANARLFNTMPRLGVTKAYTQQQGRDGKAANPEQSGDAVAGVVGDIKNGSHGLAYAGNDQKPQADLAGFGPDIRPNRDRQSPGANAP